MKEFTIKTSKREQLVDITQQVNEIVAELANTQDLRAILVFVPHATCALVVNENYDEAVQDDVLEALRKIAPKGVWKHDAIDDNGDAHVKAALVGPSIVLPVEQGRLKLGTWQSLALAEFDGPRERRVLLIPLGR